MDENTLRYAEMILEIKGKRKVLPGGVAANNRADVIKDCESYKSYAIRMELEKDWSKRSIYKHKMDCIEFRLKRYVDSWKHHSDK